MNTINAINIYIYNITIATSWALAFPKPQVVQVDSEAQAPLY